jgi:thioredoxin 2
MSVAAAPIQLDPRGLLLICPQCGQRNRAVYQRLGQTFRCGQCHQTLPQIGEPVEVDDPDGFDTFTGQSALPVLVDFWAPWCGPCKMVAPELVKVANQLAGKLVIAKVNTEESPRLAQQLGITAIPTLVLFKAGREIARQPGARPAPAILQFIRQNNLV